MTNSHTNDKPLAMATAPARNRNVLSGIGQPTIVDASMIMTKTTRYTHTPYWRIWFERERGVSGSRAELRGITAYQQFPRMPYESPYSEESLIFFRNLPVGRRDRKIPETGGWGYEPIGFTPGSMKTGKKCARAYRLRVPHVHGGEGSFSGGRTPR